MKVELMDVVTPLLVIGISKSDKFWEILTSDMATPQDNLDVTASILEYREKNGRSVHKYNDGYHFINEDGETRRLDLQHHLWYLTLDGKLSLVPSLITGTAPKRVLDLGTGAGIWATDFAEEFPESEITAVDMKSINPRFHPPNITFTTANYEEDWSFPHKFDYIHSRMANSSVANWPAYIRKAFDALAPSGCLELQEFHLATSSSPTFTPSTSALANTSSLISASAAKSSQALIDISTLPALLASVGFEDVTVALEARWPSNGTWPDTNKEKELGRWNNINFVSGIGGFMAWFLPGLGWKGEDIENLVEEVKREMKDEGMQAYWPVIVVCGRKPA
ncbi:S-adenosyl-L-methionine-dependent methyltransferase [Cercophora newfieldiana]|uniref:S-adenosyl-L-methionine-dependent methyltransferase n=1 Tax=Cercophora newfieldiana TaxID=92897 RepID=A0AA39XTL9_9PEZI|nr:S-adenosyl-L-methionine-dependent methyltransferase [Cercophora newfieldiana]